MPLILFYYSSFKRSLKVLDSGQKAIVKRILNSILVYYGSNCTLPEVQKQEPRFFYKKLRKPYYEAGIENKIRVLIERDKSKCFVVLAGNHDQIRRFLTGH